MKSGTRTLLWLSPFLIFAALLAVMAGNLGRSPHVTVRSQMIGKPVSSFTYAGMEEGTPGLASTDLADGRPVLVNLFASWCIPCAAEAPQLQKLRDAGVVIHGIAVRDTPDDMNRFLARHGNPFDRIGDDDKGRSLLDFGASGVPETYVVDGRGIIRFQQLGEIRPEDVKLILAELEKAQ